MTAVGRLFGETVDICNSHAGSRDLDAAMPLVFVLLTNTEQRYISVPAECIVKTDDLVVGKIAMVELVYEDLVGSLQVLQQLTAEELHTTAGLREHLVEGDLLLTDKGMHLHSEALVRYPILVSLTAGTKSQFRIFRRTDAREA